MSDDSDEERSGGPEAVPLPAEDDSDNAELDNDDTELPRSHQKRNRVPTELDPEKLKAFEESERRRGVVYVSRIPPFMKPVKLRHMLEQFAKIGRVYLAPEDPSVQARRVKAGGNKKQMFTEAWVEFEDKHEARAVADALNSTPFGGGKRGFYSSDLWNIKYLKHFKWHHLTEKIAYQQRIRAQKLRLQMTAAKRDAEVYVGRAEQAKAIEKMEERRAAVAAKADEGGGGEGGGKRKRAPPADGGDARGAAEAVVRRQFRQRQPLPDRLMGTNRPAGAAIAEGAGQG